MVTTAEQEEELPIQTTPEDNQKNHHLDDCMHTRNDMITTVAHTE